MQSVEALSDEAGRIAAIRRYGLIEAGQDDLATRLCRIVARIHGAPVATVSVIDTELQLFMGKVGLDCASTTRDAAFCNHTIRRHEPLCVPDALADPRFADNPLVTGPPHIRAYMGMPLQLGSGHNSGALCVIDHVVRPDFVPANTEMLAELATVMIEVMEVRMLSRTDSLTGLASRRHFLDEFAREVGRADRYGRPLSLMLVDIDHFKKVNDEHGHAAGDTVLRQIAGRMRNCLREQDVVGRIGGEEFAILMPETTGPRTASVARRLRARISGTAFDTPAGHLGLTVSIGVATASGAGATVESLMQRADDELYRAKAEGRDCVRLASEQPDGGWLRAG